MKRLAVCLMLAASPLVAGQEAEEYRAKTIDLLMEAYNSEMTREYCMSRADGIVEVTLSFGESEIVVPVDCAMWHRWIEYEAKK